MKCYGLPFFSLLPFFFLIVLATAITLACGSSSGPRIIQSVTVSPVSADAQSYPDGLVPFTAAGYYSGPPSPVSPVAATWGACAQDGSTTTAITVSTGGAAQCTAGSTGTYTVWAFVLKPGGATCNLITACGGGCGRVTGTAQLTCP